MHFSVWVVPFLKELKVKCGMESCMDVRVGLKRKLSAKELMLLNCGVAEDS